MRLLARKVSIEFAYDYKNIFLGSYKMNPFDILKNLDVEELKKKSADALSKMKDIKATGESGGGFVKVTLNGEFFITSIDFEENSFIKDDLPAFRDLIISAQNEAVAKIKEELQKNLFK